MEFLKSIHRFEKSISSGNTYIPIDPIFVENLDTEKINAYNVAFILLRHLYNLNKGPDYYHHFTAHSEKHIKAIANHLYLWLIQLQDQIKNSKIKLDERDMFILILAISLHDISMINLFNIDKDEDGNRHLAFKNLKLHVSTPLPKYEELEAIRKVHSEISYRIITEKFESNDLFSNVANELVLAAFLAFGHSAEVKFETDVITLFPNVSNDDPLFQERTVSSKNLGVRIDSEKLLLLVFLIKIGDALDITANRLHENILNEQNLNKVKHYPFKDRYFTVKHLLIQNISFEKSTILLEVCFPKEFEHFNRFEELLKCCLKKPIQQNFDQIKALNGQAENLNGIFEPCEIEFRTTYYGQDRTRGKKIMELLCPDLIAFAIIDSGWNNSNTIFCSIGRSSIADFMEERLINCCIPTQLHPISLLHATID